MSVSAGRRRRSGPKRSSAAAHGSVRSAGKAKRAHKKPSATTGSSPDLASRIRLQQAKIRTRIQRPETLISLLRALNTTLEPEKIAELVLEQAVGWLPVPCWALLSADQSGRLSTLADRNLGSGHGLTASVVARWVMSRNEDLLAANLSTDDRRVDKSAVAVLAFPLVCRGKRIGALVALDPRPSIREPRLSPVLLRGIHVLLEPVAAAIENAVRLKRTEALSVTDDLTQLFNSRYLNLVLRREAKRALRSGRPLSVLFLDLDGFKSVNDNHGHLAGSRALVEAAMVIGGSARETDVASRFGGDEFAMVLPDTDAEGAFAVGERVRERIAAHRFLSADGFNVRLTASVGVATLPDVGASAEDVVRAADAAMYRVKDRGKNGIEIATPPADK